MAFIRDILDLDVVDAQILEGTQLHKKDFDEDELFSTSVDVRAKFNDGTEVIIEIQVRKQHYFLNRFVCHCTNVRFHHSSHWFPMGHCSISVL